jgi:hypothetical protein
MCDTFMQQDAEMRYRRTDNGMKGIERENGKVASIRRPFSVMFWV